MTAEVETRPVTVPGDGIKDQGELDFASDSSFSGLTGGTDEGFGDGGATGGHQAWPTWMEQGRAIDVSESAWAKPGRVSAGTNVKGFLAAEPASGSVTLRDRHFTPSAVAPTE